MSNKKKKNKYESYYDGHYIDSGLPQEERDRIAAESIEKNKELKGWPDPNE